MGFYLWIFKIKEFNSHVNIDQQTQSDDCKILFIQITTVSIPPIWEQVAVSGVLSVDLNYCHLWGRVRRWSSGELWPGPGDTGGGWCWYKTGTGDNHILVCIVTTPHTPQSLTSCHWWKRWKLVSHPPYTNILFLCSDTLNTFLISQMITKMKQNTWTCWIIVNG